MSDLRQIAQQFLDTLAANDVNQYEQVLSEDVGLRVWRWDGSEARRPRQRVAQYLMDEWSAWPDARLQTFTIIAGGECAAVEFRIQATEQQRYVEHNRSAFLTIKDEKVQTIDLYCPEPVPSARRDNWVAPAAMSDDELNRLFESFQYTFDIREWIPPNVNGRSGLRGGHGGSGDAHPGSNGVGGVRWSAQEADAKIEEMIQYHKERNIGFAWYVGPYDTPADLSARLARQGLVFAGDQAFMARIGLDQLDIPTNPNVEIELIDGTQDESIEAMLQIVARGFNWTPAQIYERRPSFFEGAKNPELRKKEISYLARLNGMPVANGHLALRGGIAYLGGAATLPAYRNQKIYSTLLRRRLADAHVRGYNIAAIHAEPMSRRVVSRYDFKEYGRFYIYAWMPVIDMTVIKSLVPDE